MPERVVSLMTIPSNATVQYVAAGVPACRRPTPFPAGRGACRYVALLLLFGIAALVPASLRAEIEFVGVLKTAEKTLIALTDTTTAKTEWVAVGQTFAGHTLRAHHTAPDAVTLAKAGAELRLPLKDDAKIKSARFELSGTVTFGTGEKLDVIRATLLFDQENVFPLQDGLVYRITPRRLPDGNIRFGMSIERMLADNKTERVSAPAITALPDQPFRLQIGDLGFAFSPRSP